MSRIITSEEPKLWRTSVLLDLQIRKNLVTLAGRKHTTLSHLINEAVEGYLERYVEAQKEKKPIMVQ